MLKLWVQYFLRRFGFFQKQGQVRVGVFVFTFQNGVLLFYKSNKAQVLFFGYGYQGKRFARNGVAQAASVNCIYLSAKLLACFKQNAVHELVGIAPAQVNIHAGVAAGQTF